MKGCRHCRLGLDGRPQRPVQLSLRFLVMQLTRASSPKNWSIWGVDVILASDSASAQLTLQISEHLLAKSGKNSRGNSTDFGPDRFRGRVSRPSQPVRSLWAASLALSDSDQQPRQIGGMSVGGASYSRGSSGFPGLCRTCVPLEGHRDLLRRLVGSRPRCQVRWRIGFRVEGSRRISSSMKRQAFCIASIRVPSL